MDPAIFIDTHLPLADLVVLDNLLGDIESRTGSRDVSTRKGHESNGTSVSVTSTDAANGNPTKYQNGYANGSSSAF